MKLTEEQLEQLKNLNDSKVNDILGFTTLVVGRWYKYRDCILNYQGMKGNILQAYGHVPHFKWFDEPDNFGFSSEEWIEATREEVEEALIKEAKKRGFENVGDLSLIFVNGANFKKGYFCTNNNMFYFQEGNNTLRLDGVEIFNNGKWAKIVDDKSGIKDEIKQIEQRLKELRDKL